MSCDPTNTWLGVTVDDYGWTGQLVIQQDAVAQDISTYTTRQFILLSPTGEVKTVTAVFETNGTDGVLEHEFATGVIDAVGEWAVQARISKTGAVITSSILYFDVAPRIE